MQNGDGRSVQNGDGIPGASNRWKRLDFALFFPGEETRDAVRDAGIG